MDEAIRLSPRDPLLWVFEHMKGVTLLNLNRNDEALEWMEKAAAYPNAGFWAFSGLAAAQSALSHLDDAAKSLARALEVNPKLSQRFLEDTYPGALMRYKECLKIAGLVA
jgi:tetratricopeptide (TPR) repeat protein